MDEVPVYAPSKDEIKQRLPLEYVCSRFGITATLEHPGRCPFHKGGLEDNPSFNLHVSDDGFVRWFCYPCGLGGDLFDLIQHFHGCSFPEAIEHATALLGELPEDFEPPQRQPRRKADPTDLATVVNDARTRAAAADHSGILAARVGYADVAQPDLCVKWDAYLRDVWGWGLTAAGEVAMPHWTADGQLVGCKKRAGDGTRSSVDGSSYLGQLYGAWLGRRSQDVLLLEGETDAAFAGWLAQTENVQIDVFALPSGAGTPIEDSFLQFLKRSRVIYLAFDPDAAGVAATWRWLETLAAIETNVKICCLPLGKDLRDAQPSLQHLLETARAPLRKPESIDLPEAEGGRGLGGYLRPGKEGDVRQITDWYIEPTAQLSGGDPGYDVNLTYRGITISTVIRLSDLTSMRDISRWCNRRGLIFTGREDDLKRIAEHVLWRGSVVPEVFQTDQVGLHGPPQAYAFAGASVVFPNGYVGKMPWRYTPSGQVSDVSDKVLLPSRGTVRWDWLADFLRLSAPTVTHPFLAWLVAATRRPETTQFPLLFIGGSSGVGKSTLARLGLRLVGSRIELDLGNVTPFILLRTLASSRSLPVFIDEWTRMSRKDTLQAFQGTVPILYTGGSAERGQADLSSTSYPMTAPTIVAGEDTFTLDRELERTITITPSRDAQNHHALACIATAPLERVGHLLHSWVADKDDLPSLTSVTSDRPEYNRNVLLAGWETLRLFLEDASHSSPDVPELPERPDLSSLEIEPDEVENVYEQALLAGASMRDADRHAVVWADPGRRGTWIRFQMLVGLIQSRNVDIQLPGGSRAMKAYFEERYGRLELGTSVTPPGAMTPLRAWLIPGYLLPVADDIRSTWVGE